MKKISLKTINATLTRLVIRPAFYPGNVEKSTKTPNVGPRNIAKREEFRVKNTAKRESFMCDSISKRAIPRCDSIVKSPAAGRRRSDNMFRRKAYDQLLEWKSE